MSVSRRTLTVVVGLLVTLATFAAGSVQAFGQRPAPDGGSAGQPVQAPTQITITHGSPTWVFVVIALTAAVVSAAVVLAALRLRHSRVLGTSHALQS